MSKQRSREQVKAIDKFIIENYPLHGADFCAQALRESLQYIRGRIGANGVIKSKKMRSADDMRQRIEYLKLLNSELRLENMKLIDENRRLKNG